MMKKKLFVSVLALALCAGLMTGPSASAHPPAFSPDYVTEVLTVTGRVENALSLRVEDLKAFPVYGGEDVSVTGRAGDEVGRLQKVRGVRLRDVLDRAGIIVEDHNDVKKTVIIAGASDGYKVVFSWSEIFNTLLGDGILILIEEDGRPLKDEEGRIALISRQDIRTGPRHVKWLNSIEVRKIVD